MDGQAPGRAHPHGQSEKSTSVMWRDVPIVDPAIGRVPPEEIRRSRGWHDAEIVPMIRTAFQSAAASE